MKLLVLICTALVSFTNIGHAALITKGTAITEARKDLAAAKHPEIGLDMISRAPDTALDFREVDEGVLILSHSTKTGLITGLSYTLMDERPKGTRKTFDFGVESFDTTTGNLLLNTKTPALQKSRPALHKNDNRPNPITAVLSGAREFRSGNNQQLTKFAADEVLGVLNRFAGTFTVAPRDCRVPEQGPKAALEPAHVANFTNAAKESVSVEFFVFSEKFSTLQITVDSKTKRYLKSDDKALIEEFSKVMRNAGHNAK